MRRIAPGVRVDIRAKGSWANGEWGIVRGFDGEAYHVAINDGKEHLVFARDELIVRKRQQAADAQQITATPVDDSLRKLAHVCGRASRKFLLDFCGQTEYTQLDKIALSVIVNDLERRIETLINRIEKRVLEAQGRNRS